MAGFGTLTAKSLNIGRELQFTVVINGTPYTYLGLVRETERKPRAKLLEEEPTNNDGVSVFRTTHHGHEYDVHLTRQDGTFDYLVDALQNNYFGGSTPPVVTGYETVRNPSGSVDQWQLLGGAIVPEHSGSFRGADPVNNVLVKMVFGQRISVSGSGAGQTINLNQPTSYL